MFITFAQYSILMASQHRVTYSQLKKRTSFDHLMVNYYTMGLLNIGLISASDKEGTDSTYYQLTDEGAISIREYERANPELVIKSAY